MSFGRWATRVAVAVSGVSGLLAMVPACTSTARVSDVYMALDGDGTRKRNVFYTDTKEIHCIAEAGIGRDGVTLEGFIRQIQAWDFQSSQFVDVNRVLGYAELKAERGDSLTKFDLKLDPGSGAEQEANVNNPPYVAGRYQCEILLDGSPAGTSIFNIEFAPCPATTIVNGTRCFGFYRDNVECPAAGETGAQEPKCLCTIQGGWKC